MAMVLALCLQRSAFAVIDGENKLGGGTRCVCDVNNKQQVKNNAPEIDNELDVVTANSDSVTLNVTKGQLVRPPEAFGNV